MAVFPALAALLVVVLAAAVAPAQAHPPGADEREPGGDRSFVPLDHPEIWLKQGDPAIYFSP